VQEALNIVVVDDEPFIRQVTAEILQRHGHIVHQCANADEALEALRREVIDLLFTDVTMPQKDGIALIEEALDDRLISKKQIVAITGLETDSYHVQWLRSRNISVLSKPFKATDLLSGRV